MSKQIILGLCGKKQSGKSSVTSFLVNDEKFVEVYWAEPLKNIIGRQLFFLTQDQLFGDKKEEFDPRWGMTPRDILQKVGTDLFRNHFDTEFWVKRGVYRLVDLMNRFPDIRIAVSDCRFPNELEAIKNLGGYTIRIIRNDQDHTDEHESEKALDSVRTDFVVSANSGDLEGLYNQVRGIVRIIEEAENAG